MGGTLVSCEQSLDFDICYCYRKLHNYMFVNVDIVRGTKQHFFRDKFFCSLNGEHDEIFVFVST